MTEKPTLDEDGRIALSDLFVATAQAMRAGGNGVVRLEDPTQYDPDEGRVGRDPDGGFYIGDGEQWVHSEDIGLTHPELDALETAIDELESDLNAHVDEPEEVHGAGESEYVALTDREDQAVDYDSLEKVPGEFTPEEHGDGAHDETVASSTDVDVVVSDLDDHEQDTDNPHASTLEDVRSADNQLGGDVDANGNAIVGVEMVKYTPTDVRELPTPGRGLTAYHDGSGDHAEGPVHYDGTDWVSTVDGTTIDDD